MFGRKSAVKDPEPTEIGLEDEQVSNAQESLPVPWVFGERRIAVRWISRVYNQRAEEAPISRPGKKG